MSKEQNEQQENKALHIAGVSGSYSPTLTEVQKMYDYLKMYFHRSQMNGLVDIDTHERGEIKKMLRLPDNYR
jgi:spore coat polysaccharide biosynthesis predicted glycosyltransferase SpsG